MLIVTCGRRSRIRRASFRTRSLTTALLLLLPPRPGGRELSSPCRLTHLRGLGRAGRQDQRKSEGESGHAPMMLPRFAAGTAGRVRAERRTIAAAWAASNCSFNLAIAAVASLACMRAAGRALRHLPRRLSAKSRSEEHTSELQSPTNLVCRL